MWNDILGALCIMGMIMVCGVLFPAAPKLTDALCDRIRHGVPASVDELEKDGDEEPEEGQLAAASETADPPAAARTSSTRAAA